MGKTASNKNCKRRTTNHDELLRGQSPHVGLLLRPVAHADRALVAVAPRHASEGVNVNKTALLPDEVHRGHLHLLGDLLGPAAVHAVQLPDVLLGRGPQLGPVDLSAEGDRPKKRKRSRIQI